MKSVLSTLVCLCALLGAAAQNASVNLAGVSRREPNTTLKLPEAPPVFGYKTEPAFGSLRVVDPLAVATPPGEKNRLFIIEQSGRVIVLSDLANPQPSVFLDLSGRVAAGGERGLLGIAFHPGYATNRYFYLFYTTQSGGLKDRLSRFEVSPDDPNRALADSEVILIDQADDASNHNGGDIHFGPDGYLYVGLGDEGGGNDDYRNSQRLNKDFFAGMLRIDVDRRAGNLEPNPHPAVVVNTATGRANYSVPADNPFVGLTRFNNVDLDSDKVRTEFWAVGLRNPWRFSFDPATGTLWCADVGQGTREEVNIITRGGNYGWYYREGKIARPGSSQPPSEFSAIDPIYDYGRSVGYSITGGVVYRGERLSQLTGSYVFGDYGSGQIWALRYDGGADASTTRLAANSNISAFGYDPRNGDILICDLGADTLKRLVYSSTSSGEPFPETLADTGAFSDLTTLTPRPGVVEYEINHPFWSDNATKRRWFSVPDVDDVVGFARQGNWSFPAGTVWIKHFELEMTKGEPKTARRVETRFLVRNADGIYGLTYRWDEAQQNATLVPEGGLDESLLINDGGIIRTQIWRFPSRSECRTCHTASEGYALGFNTAQLNRAVAHGEASDNQIRLLSRLGYLNAEVAEVHTLPALAARDDQSQSLEFRVRSYLEVNCANCHQPGGAGLGQFDARMITPTSLAGLIDGPLNNSGGNSENRVIKPGSLDHSMMLQRISTLGAGRMPPVGSHVLDTEAIALLSAWITNDLATAESWSAWQTRLFGSSTAENAQRDSDPDGDGASNYTEYMTGRNPLDASDAWKVSIGVSGAGVQIEYPRAANRGYQVQVTTNLFDPESWIPLEVRGNEPVFPSSTSTNLLFDTLGNAPVKYYRVRVFEP